MLSENSEDFVVSVQLKKDRVCKSKHLITFSPCQWATFFCCCCNMVRSGRTRSGTHIIHSTFVGSAMMLF